MSEKENIGEKICVEKVEMHSRQWYNYKDYSDRLVAVYMIIHTIVRKKVAKLKGNWYYIMIIRMIKRKIFQHKWRKSNPHNYTEAVNCFDMDKVSVGRYTYGGLDVLNSGTNSKLVIGNFCSIASNVFFCLGGEHLIDTISSYPFKVKVMGDEYEAISKGNIEVGDDVWIGHGVQVMSGVKIGQGAVIAAGAVVTKDVPPYAVVGGVPAKVIKYRFAEEDIKKMLEIDYSQLDEKTIRMNIDALYAPVETVDQIEWMPKRNKM